MKCIMYALFESKGKFNLHKSPEEWNSLSESSSFLDKLHWSKILRDAFFSAETPYVGLDVGLNILGRICQTCLLDFNRPKWQEELCLVLTF